MPGGLTLLASLPANIPTPPAGKITIFFNITAGLPYYKDSSGSLFSLLGSTGPQGPQGVPVAFSNDEPLFEDYPLISLASINPALSSLSLASSPTPTPDATQFLYSLTALAAAAAFVNPTGSPFNGQKLIIRIKDDGTARGLSWGTAYTPGGVSLPTTTVLSKILTLGFIYNTDNALNKWQLVASAQEA